jgi:hypothetical protein
MLQIDSTFDRPNSSYECQSVPARDDPAEDLCILQVHEGLRASASDHSYYYG